MYCQVNIEQNRNDAMNLNILLTDMKFESEKISNGIRHLSSALKVVTWCHRIEQNPKSISLEEVSNINPTIWPIFS